MQVETWHTRIKQTNGRCKRFHDRELPLPTSILIFFPFNFSDNIFQECRVQFIDELTIYILFSHQRQIFKGNCDHVTPVLNAFHEPLLGRYIRYIPWKYNYPCVRMEFYGCDENELQPDP